MKTCTRCSTEKPLEDFDRNKRKRDGRDPSCKACAKAYREANRVRILANKAEYYKANRGRILDYLSEWRDGNRDRIAANGSEYRKANKERIAERKSASPNVYWESNYRQRAKKIGFEPVVKSFTRDELISRWGNACVHCGGRFEELDHWPRPVSRGGEHSLDNCRPSCLPCNRRSWQSALIGTVLGGARD